MCGRFVSSSKPDEVARYFDVDTVAERLVESPPEPNFNVAPTSDVMVVVEQGEERRLDLYRWGLLPFWAKDLSAGSKMINARAETIDTKNAYRAAFRKRRCIVPADGFYEWKLVAGLPGAKPTKQPMYIHRADGDQFAFAGLWERWRPKGVDPDEPYVSTCAVVTGAANAAVAPIHDRMPVMLPPAAWDRWLDPDFDDVDVLRSLLVPAPASIIAFHPVSTAVNNVRNRGPELLEPVPARVAPSP